MKLSPSIPMAFFKFLLVADHLQINAYVSLGGWSNTKDLILERLFEYHSTNLFAYLLIHIVYLYTK